jgi:hypothetical protein
MMQGAKLPFAALLSAISLPPALPRHFEKPANLQV